MPNNDQPSPVAAPVRSGWRRLVPTREQLLANRWLRWLVPHLHHAHLWHWSRRGVALGVALGVFFGLLVPIAQIPLSAAAAVVLRANIAAAAASTLVTNPVTFAPVYYAAYRVGAVLTGEAADGAPAPALLPIVAAPAEDSAGRWWESITAVGKPLALGLAIFATTAGLLSYSLISLAWRWRIVRKRQRRRLR